jgi:hypothetical protein
LICIDTTQDKAQWEEEVAKYIKNVTMYCKEGTLAVIVLTKIDASDKAMRSIGDVPVEFVQFVQECWDRDRWKGSDADSVMKSPLMFLVSAKDGGKGVDEMVRVVAEKLMDGADAQANR